MSIPRREKLLVVDDDPSMGEGLALCLGDDYEVTAVPSGEQALELARKETYPVVILDLVMDGLSGLATLERLRKSDAMQRVIILTGHSDQASAVSALNLGAFKYELKPFRLAHFKNILREGFERYARDLAAFTSMVESPEQLRSLGLSTREAEIVFWAIQGETNQEIADRLQISQRTVEKHFEHILTALKVSCRIKLASRVRTLWAQACQTGS